MTDAETILTVDEAQRASAEMISKVFENVVLASVNEFQKYIDMIKCEDCGAANMTIYMTGVDRKRRCRKCHAEYIRPNPPRKSKGKK
jgi:hypothetical protein